MAENIRRETVNEPNEPVAPAPGNDLGTAGQPRATGGRGTGGRDTGDQATGGRDEAPDTGPPGAEVSDTTTPDTGAPDTAGRGDGKSSPFGEQTLLEQLGGVPGMIFSAVPILVFVVANSAFGLIPAIWCALGAAVAIAVVRLLRRETLQPAVAGLFGTGIAAFIAFQTGEARGFFLYGIWMSLLYCGIFVVSILVRWPLVGVVWSLLNGSGMGWRNDKPSLRAYDLATAAFAIVFAARFVVQNWLYQLEETNLLAAARIAMGVPLFALALLVSIWAARRAGKRAAMLARDAALAGHAGSTAHDESGAPAGQGGQVKHDGSGQHTGSGQQQESDEEIERRLREKYRDPDGLTPPG